MNDLEKILGCVAIGSVAVGFVYLFARVIYQSIGFEQKNDSDLRNKSYTPENKK